MTDTLPAETKIQSRSWLKTYYFTRAAVSLVWVAIAFHLREGPAGPRRRPTGRLPRLGRDRQCR